jgi:transcriptional regulator with GAF, ATPase, and Fis domain
VILSDGPVLSLGADLLPGGRAAITPAAAANVASPASVTEGQPRTMEDAERRHIVDVLESVNYVIEGPSGAAQVLSLHPNTLRSRMKKLGISRPPASHIS